MEDMAAAVGSLPELHLGKQTSQATNLSPTVEPAVQRDPELVRVMDAWPVLPGHIRQAILALLSAAAISRSTSDG